MVTIIDVRYPNGAMPRSLCVIPAKTMSNHALTKNIGPAATSLKNALIAQVPSNSRWGATVTATRYARLQSSSLGAAAESDQRPAAPGPGDPHAIAATGGRLPPRTLAASGHAQSLRTREGIAMSTLQLSRWQGTRQRLMAADGEYEAMWQASRTISEGSRA